MNILSTKHVIGTVTFLLLWAVSVHLFGQDRWLKLGDERFRKGEYAAALESFSYTYEQHRLPLAKARMADCYLKMREYHQAQDLLGSMDLGELADAEYQLKYAGLLMQGEQYEEAEQVLEAFLKRKPGDLLGKAWFKACNSIPELTGNASQYQVRRPRFNSKAADFAPVKYGTGLLFVSARKRDLGVVYYAENQGSGISDLYVAADTGKAVSKPLPGAVNSPFFEGPASIHPDSTLMIFSRNRNKGGASGLLEQQLFMARRENDRWGAVSSLPLNQAGVSMAHPAFSPDGKWLYFSADLPGGAGGKDLYRVSFNGTDWGTPENLGPTINTPGDEMFPYLSAGQTLYFASTGHAGLGGLDIFSVALGSGSPGQVINPGAPINSSKDDFGILWEADGKSGWFSSNRKGFPHNDDIYHFKKLRPEFECAPQVEAKLCHTFFEVNSIELDPEFPLVYEWDMGDGTHLRGIEVRHCHPGPGDYLVQLNVVDSTTGFVFYNQATYPFTIEEPPQPYITAPTEIFAGVPTVFDASQSTLEGVEIDEYHWEFESGMYALGISSTFTFPVPGTYEVRLGVVGNLEGQDTLQCVTREIEVKASKGSPKPVSVPEEQPRQNEVVEEKEEVVREKEAKEVAIVPEIPETGVVAPEASATGPIRKTVSPLSLRFGGQTHEFTPVLNGQTVKSIGDRPVIGDMQWQELQEATLYETLSSQSSGLYFLKLPDGRVFEMGSSVYWVKELKDPRRVEEINTFGEVCSSVTLLDQE